MDNNNNNIGCFYNPRPSPGRCIKDPYSTNVDKQCKIEDGRCRLNLSEKILVPTKPLYKKNQKNLKQNKIPRKTPKSDISETTGNQFLSGPISAYSFEYKGKSYNFFGDAHFSMTNTCNMPCQDFDISTKKPINPTNSESCWTISRLLVDIFTKAASEKKYVDFYIEIPYTPLGGITMDKENEVEYIEEGGFLPKLFFAFRDCFVKNKCPYEYVRFHYVDVRLQHKIVRAPKIMMEMYKQLEAQGFDIPDIENLLPKDKVTNKFTTFEMYLTTTMIMKSLQELGEKIQSGNSNKSEYIELTNNIFKEMFMSGGQTASGKQINSTNLQLLDVYLKSDNFSDDVVNLFRRHLLKVKDPSVVLDVNDALISPHLIVNRRGKNMHRIRAQLEALENENKSEIKNDIIEFIKNYYIKFNKQNNAPFIKIWTQIMKIYNNLINPKVRKFGDIRNILNNLIDQYKKASKYVMRNADAHLMDAYTLARMFRTYSGKNNIDSDKVLVYAGNAHIKTYVEFFKQMGAKINKYGEDYDMGKIKSSDDFQRCLKVNIKDFL